MTASSPPRVLRFQSSALRAPAFGLVVDETDGVPVSALNLTALDARLGAAFDAFNTQGGWDLAAQQASHPQAEPEPVSPAQVLPPVDISLEDIHGRRRFILSMGLNYESHRRETNRGKDLLMINALATTGAYEPITLQPEAHLPDIEAEMGCVLLADVDLGAIPAMRDLERRLAYFTVNDLTDRAPIILDEVEGYTPAKSDPGFKPIGPWMVPGTHLPVFSGPSPLDVKCVVTKPGQTPRIRQHDQTTGIIRNPAQVLALLAEKLAANPALDAPDRQRRRHPFALRVGDRFLLPAGSLIFTGTPGGTSIRPPALPEKLRLLLRAGFSMRRARALYVRDCRRRAAALGYLEPGDTVETSVSQLGTQRWEIRGTKITPS